MKYKFAYAAVASVTAAAFYLFPELRPFGFGEQNLEAALDESSNEFCWDFVTPSKELIWHKCYPGLQCARLEVSLDYANPEGRKAVIALTRKPAMISSKLPFYKGPILLNPGGPGESGIQLLRKSGTLLSIILGPLFDLVSFDPRGIGHSTPRTSFFKTDAERALWNANSNLHLVNNSDEGISRMWAASRLMGMLAGDRDDGYLEHINTPNTARDMLSIVKAYGEDQLQYWGFSYGTVLGATFATMFPDKVKRMVLDGVLDAEDYYSAVWRTNLLDTEKVFDAFFEGCADAGPDRCSLYSQKSDDIRQNVGSILDRMKHRALPAKTDTAYGLVDLWMVRFTIFRAFYNPRALFSPLASALSSLSTGDAGPMLDLRNSLGKPPFECACNDPGSRKFDTVREGPVSIWCNDGEKVPEDLSDAENHLRYLLRFSQFADMWADIRTNCAGWPKPGPSFKGPFEANTSHPILLVGNTADPVTPLAAAKKASLGFKNSVVLTQDSVGHCSISAPSICTQLHISRYFNDGTLPEPGTVCSAIGSNFPPRHSKVEVEVEQTPLYEDEGTPETDKAFLDAVGRLSELRLVHGPPSAF